MPIITEPAVDGALGMTGLFFHETEEEKDARLKAMQSEENASRHLLPPSVSALMGAYTGNDSYFAGGYGDINLDFYGAGNVEFSKPISLNTTDAVIMQTVMFKIPDTRLYVGATHRYINAEIKPTNLGGLINGLPPICEEKLTFLLI